MEKNSGFNLRRDLADGGGYNLAGLLLLCFFPLPKTAITNYTYETPLRFRRGLLWGVYSICSLLLIVGSCIFPLAALHPRLACLDLSLLCKNQRDNSPGGMGYWCAQYKERASGHCPESKWALKPAGIIVGCIFAQVPFIISHPLD